MGCDPYVCVWVCVCPRAVYIPFWPSRAHLSRPMFSSKAPTWPYCALHTSFSNTAPLAQPGRLRVGDYPSASLGGISGVLIHLEEIPELVQNRLRHLGTSGSSQSLYPHIPRGVPPAAFSGAGRKDRSPCSSLCCVVSVRRRLRRGARGRETEKRRLCSSAGEGFLRSGWHA